MNDAIELQMRVKIKVWPNDASSFEVSWTMPASVLDDKGAKALLQSALRQSGMTMRECVAELSVDNQVVVCVTQQLRMVKTTKMYPK